ncbi:MAG: helix-hairpin-helix domain-containing protein [Actinomycetota bacterium]
MSEGSLRDRLSSLSRGELIGVVAVAAVTLLGAGLWYVRSLPTPVEVVADPPPPVPAPDGSPSPSAAPVLVDVAGWVRRPGVYRLTSDARVIDAIDAAGGARPGAELQALNLAAPLVDGTQILVPRQGQAPPAPVSGSGASVPGGTLVNVNTATADQLETLPGIGEVTAQAIIDHRTENGPFTSVDQLLDVSGIGDVTLEGIRDLVTV